MGDQPAGTPPAPNDPAPNTPPTPQGDPAKPDPAPAGATPPEPPGDLGEGGKRALDAERKARTEAEKTAKAANAELEKLRKAAMSDQEKAVAVARDEGRSEATKAAGERLAAAEIKAALTGVVPDPMAIVEDLALGRYVTEDGDVDAAAVTKLAEKYAALGAANPPPPPPAVPGVPAGARSDNGPTQISRAEIKNMAPAEIVQARKDGRLRDVLSTGG